LPCVCLVIYHRWCGKNKKVANKVIAECVTEVLHVPHFDIFCDVIEQTHGNMESVCLYEETKSKKKVFNDDVIYALVF